MKKLNKVFNVFNVFNVGVALCVGIALASCDDFLTITPQNEIVLENFWTEEADVNSVLTSCYTQLASSDCVSRMIIWGELRSDDMTNGPSTNNAIREILKENILETSTYTTWQCFYQCINRCNTVIHYAPEVNAKDPNFTDSELEATIAEATVLRALCYFYLIRSFRDVPYTTEPSIDDTQNYLIAASSFETVLDTIIADVEAVKDKAVKSYGEESVENSCRITRWAAYALLADMYLWKGDYENCIKNCDLVINQKIQEYEDEKEDNPNGMTVELYGKYPLISESPAGTNYAGTTYNEIFGEGNSFESIFELTYDNHKSPTNSALSSLYGGTSTNGSISCPTFIYDGVFGGTNDYFKKTDCRYLENLEESSSKVLIRKYYNDEVSFKMNTTTGEKPKVTASKRSDNYSNWIVYRLTDVMLMRAEAEVELAGNVGEGGALTDDQTAHYRNAFACVSAVWKRANCKRTATTDTLIYSDYATSRLTMEDLVMSERQRELMFEGKRWYDFVRLCRREGDNSRMIEKVLPKFEENGAAIRIRLADPNRLYWPYSKTELKANTLLKQNPAYVTDEGFEI